MEALTAGRDTPLSAGSLLNEPMRAATPPLACNPIVRHFRTVESVADGVFYRYLRRTHVGGVSPRKKVGALAIRGPRTEYSASPFNWARLATMMGRPSSPVIALEAMACVEFEANRIRMRPRGGLPIDGTKGHIKGTQPERSGRQHQAPPGSTLRRMTPSDPGGVRWVFRRTVHCVLAQQRAVR